MAAHAEAIGAEFTDTDAGAQDGRKTGAHGRLDPNISDASWRRKKTRERGVPGAPPSIADAAFATPLGRGEGARDYLVLTSLTSNTTAWPGPTGERGLSP